MTTNSSSAEKCKWTGPRWDGECTEHNVTAKTKYELELKSQNHYTPKCSPLIVSKQHSNIVISIQYSIWRLNYG